MKTFSVLSLAIALTAGCAQNLETDTGTPAEIYVEQDNSEVEELFQEELTDIRETSADVENETLCTATDSGHVVSYEAVEQMLALTELTNEETIYTIYDRIDGIASLFEDCSDPWGMFPTTYRHITNRIIQAIEDQEIEDQEWGRKIVVDFASRYMQNLRAALTGNDPSYAWHQYYYLADHPEVSRTRAVVVAMVAHLTLDLPYSLVAIDTTEDHKNDYFVLGELMIEITPDFIDDLLFYYDTDAEDLLNGFFLGEWVDGVYGSDTTITLSYQTIRTKSWNNRWYLEQWWGGWIADSEIYAAFWAIDGVLATLDASGAI
tara:strand:- start:1290 stop:2246 length:957 start_codon:yes stop_codon:yes gene_type:complete